MYEEMTYERILDNMLERVRKDVDKREGSILYDAAAPAAYCLAKLYFELSHYADLILPDTSAGRFLDRFGLSFGMTRKKAAKAVKKGMFNMQIPIGSRFSTAAEKSLVYLVREQLEMEEGKYVYSLECETPGREGGSCTGPLLPVGYVSGLTSAELGEIITDGAEEESDEEFRERLLAKMRHPSTSGNVQDYSNWALECVGVGAARVFPLANGPGTVKIVIADEEKAGASDGLVQQVAQHIEKLRPIGADVTVKSAAEKKVDVSARVKLSKTAVLGQVQQAFQENMEHYLKDHAFEMNYLGLARIGNLLMEIPGVEDYEGMLLNGLGENMQIGEEEIAVMGTARLEVM